MSVIHEISGDVFGGMALSAGQCVGHCDALSAIEFHQGSEVNITFTDVIMVLTTRKFSTFRKGPSLKCLVTRCIIAPLRLRQQDLKRWWLY